MNSQSQLGTKADQNQIRDRFFRHLFGTERWKEFALSLYNALNHTDYKNAEDLQFEMLEDSIFMKMRNDVSFAINHSEINLWEQQSTISDNIVLRELLYYVELIKRRIRAEDSNVLHRSKRYMIPLPKLYVFYNGTRSFPKETICRLSESYEVQAEDPDIEVKVHVYNINFKEGKQELLEACKPLKEYAEIIYSIQEKSREMDLPEAIEYVLDHVPEKYDIFKAVKEAKQELKNMILREINEERLAQDLREDGKAEGKAEGLAEGEAKGRAEGKAEEKAIAVKGMLRMLKASGFDHDEVISKILEVYPEETEESITSILESHVTEQE